MSSSSTELCTHAHTHAPRSVKQSIGFNWGPCAVGNTFWTGVPLRDVALSAKKPHLFPVTVHLLTEAIKQLRAVEGEASTRNQHVTLWRGMRNLTVPQEFLADGGSEKAPMSTTHDLAVAVRCGEARPCEVATSPTRRFHSTPR